MCAGGYAYFSRYNGVDTCQSTYGPLISYASGSCYPNALGVGATRVTCAAGMVAQTAGATLRMSSAYTCPRGTPDYDQVSANLDTCLYVSTNAGGRQYYKINSCTSAGNAVLSFYSTQDCSGTAQASGTFLDGSGCNAFPLVSGAPVTDMRFNISCYAAGQGPVGPSGGGLGGSSSTGMPAAGPPAAAAPSSMLAMCMAAFAVLAAGSAATLLNGVSSSSLRVLAIVALLALASGGAVVRVSAVDTYTARVWASGTQCFTNSSIPDVVVTTDTDACLSAKDWTGARSYFAVTACAPNTNSVTLQRYADDACSSPVGAATVVSNHLCSPYGLHSLEITCGAPSTAAANVGLSIVYFEGASCSGTQHTVITTRCTPFVSSSGAVTFVQATCSQPGVSTSLSLAGFTDANCLFSAGAATSPVTNGACGTNTWSNGGSYQLVSMQGGGQFSCQGPMNGASSRQAQWPVWVAIAAIVAANLRERL